MLKTILKRLSYNLSTRVTLGQKQYLAVAVQKIHQLTQIAQQFQQKHSIDISSTDQVLRINLNNHSIVINTQTPNRQLWYSCTKSGPQRFDYVVDDGDNNKKQQYRWENNKGSQLSQQLKQDLTKIIG